MEKLLKSIENSKYILDLKEDWDGEDGIPCDKEIYDNAVKWLETYGNNSLCSFGLCRDQSIDISWNKEPFVLLLNFKKDSFCYYGCEWDRTDDKRGVCLSEIKGEEITKEALEEITKFMNNFL